MKFNDTDKMVIGFWVTQYIRKPHGTHNFYVPYIQNEPENQRFFEFLKQLEWPVFCDKVGSRCIIEVISINTREEFAEIKIRGLE